VTGSEAAPILELREVSVDRRGKRILDSVNLSIRPGEHAAILGPNGSGKSTIVRIIAGQIYPSTPTPVDPPVRLFGRERWNLSELRTRLGVISADLQHRFVTGSSLGRVTGLEAVVSSFFGSEVLFLHHEVPPDYRERALHALDRVGAAAFAKRRMHELSTGEARRILIARALVHEPELLVLDEPTTGLDIVARDDFLSMLRRIAQSGTTLLLVTHHVEEILPEIRHVVVMRQGGVMVQGPAREVLTSETLTKAYDAPVELRLRGERYELSITRDHAAVAGAAEAS
jgi:iron complex transport system ATP-binding protein